MYEVENTLDLIRDAGAIVEVNTRGIYKKKTNYTYPSPWILKRILAKGIPKLISSDAHVTDEIDAEFRNTAAMLLNSGFRTKRILHKNHWNDIALDKSGIYLHPH